ncbi:uncharacterized protein LOC128235037 isoform X2 [Mya arenaria]|uniref:uncharacterized protein LOC128235037 isoform X2 n=1 Tax=Mya arenaria TaxID=6604 RepID=UPI0022E0B75A|nr:uncharacterized protein LOC128235037 isoform X2 [Mya arenaria]XP_052805696.1 uncharacterized protein LOC128235037 isoform X2 [Mya arenaria]XP_052805697.1 uncharacterized protein LOC128235037 isoform X2 [Mya arenaria]XP_052805698.1 uncharacterized protein LOC128235037 isoform X2 [Mya arenaria]
MARKLEREMRMGTMTSRRALMERERAMDAARNPGVSRFGDCLVSVNSKSDKMLNSHLRKINSEIRRMEAQINNKMKCFVKNSSVLNHDPIILVERPASPDVVRKAFSMKSEKDVHGYPTTVDEEKPSYMRQLRSRARTPSTLTTIDAFTVKPRRKKNVWEDAADAKPEFQSTVRPYAKLTQREVSELQKGYEFHKPKLESAAQSDIDEQSHKSLPLPKKRGKDVHTDDSDEEDIGTPFITQMALMRKGKSQDRQEHTLAEINIHHRSSEMISDDGRARKESEHGSRAEKSVRFKAPVLSAPTKRGGATKRRTKTSETIITLVQQT